MMKADTVHYNRDTGVVMIEPFPSGEKFTVTESADRLTLAAGMDVHATADGEYLAIKTLVDHPLLVRVIDDEHTTTVDVMTAHPPAGGGPVSEK